MIKLEKVKKKERASLNGTKRLHLQDWMKILRYAARRAKTPKEAFKIIEEKETIRDPILRAVIEGILKGSKDGRFYKVLNDPKIKDFDFCFIGKNHQPVARAPKNLTLQGLYQIKCRVCSQQTPIIQIYFYLKNRLKIGFLSIEEGEVKIDGEIEYQELLRGQNE